MNMQLMRRQNPSHHADAAAAAGMLLRRVACLPLPGGEGRGEGEQSVPPASGRSHPAPSARRFLTNLCVSLLLAATFVGCVSKSKAKAQARNAYIAGQQAAIARMQQVQTQGQGPCVTVNGDVRNHVVPWTEGMTLAKALVAADYLGTADPAQIIILHNGIGTRVEPKQLLSGIDIPLQPGDVVHLMPQSPASRP